MPFPSYADVSQAARRLTAMVRDHAPKRRERLASDPSPRLALWLLVFSAQDIILIAYLSTLAALLGHRDALATPSAHAVLGCLSILVVGCIVARATDLPGAVRGTVYRGALLGVLAGNYLTLRHLLPVLRHDAMDAALLAADVALFRVTPAIVFERLNYAPVVEYFSFFYLSYFLLCFVYALAVLWLMPVGQNTTEFVVVTVLLYCTGQLGYIAVPAYGPVRYLAAEFTAPVRGGLLWRWVERAVEAGGALKDVFPSMHTAAPLWFSAFALMQARHDPRWRWPARVTAFFACNIIMSTLVLRWHYAVDVLAGAMLTLIAGAAGRRLARADEALRARCGLAPSFGTDGDASMRQRSCAKGR